MSDLHPDHVTPVLALEDQDACSPLVLRSAGLQAANIIRKLTNDLGYREQELTRLRADLAAEREERDKLAKEVARLREAMSRESDGAQYLANLLVEAEAALLSVAQQRGKAESERNAAQEREQRMREALANIMGNMEPDPDDPDRRRMLSNGFARWEALEDDARAALSAMRGEP